MNQNLNRMNLLLNECFVFARTTFNDWTDFTCGLKLNEEFGELSEAILIEIGQIKHKKNKEPVFGEIIDNIIMCLHFLSRKQKNEINFKIKEIKNIEKLNYSIKNVEILFTKYEKLKNELKNLDEKDSVDKHFKLIHKILNQLIKLSVVFINMQNVNIDNIFDKTLEELNFHLVMKINKWRRIEEKRE